MKHRKIIAASIVCLLLAGVASGIPGAWASSSRADWEVKWDETVAAAKKEGKLVIYSGINPEAAQALKGAFSQKYGIQLDFMLGRGAELAAKYKTEQTAGLNIPGAFNLAPSLKPQGFFAPLEAYLILPEVKDPKAWIGGKVPFMDKEKTILMLNRGYTSYVTINTQLVKEGQIKTLTDLLKPEWKGKVTFFDASIPSAGAGWSTFVLTKIYGWEKGTQFLKQFAATEPAITRDTRQQVEWVAKGKYAIAVGAQQGATTDFIKVGAPVDIIRWQEGGMINTASGLLEVPAKPENPNAATVFINWIMTKEGQAVFAKSFGNPSWRLDVPTDGIHPSRIPLPGEKLFVDDMEFYQQQMKAQKLAKEIFAKP